MTASPTTDPTSPAYAKLETGPLVWVFLLMYIVFLLSLAVWGFYKTSKLKTTKEKIDDHFVASRGLGLSVLALTVFATVFSGYTVVGVPGEIWAYGYFGLRWLYTVSHMGYPMMFMASRLHTIGKVRKYVSPTDFIKDRYGSWSLTWFTNLSMLFPAIVYAMAQFISMGATIQGMSDGKIDDFHAAAVLCVVMITYEIFGGLRAIAYTDVVQGSVLIVAFMLYFIAQEDIFGGLEKANKFLAKNDLNIMLTEPALQSWIGFGMILTISYAFYPQIIIRSQAAKNGFVVKWTYIFLVFGTWLVMVCSIGTGMAANLYLGRPGTEFFQPNAVFGIIVRRVISENVWYNILGSIMLTASAAAFMSTCDSAINACVSLITLDFLVPLIPDSYEQKQLVILYGGKLLSIAIALIALFCSRVDIGLAALLTLQGMVLCQVAPAYILGFFNLKLHPYCLLEGQVVGVAIAIFYQCASNYCVQGSTDVSWFGPIEGIQPGVYALVVNLVVAITGSFICAMVGFHELLPFDKVHIKEFKDDIPRHLLTLKADGISRPWSNAPWCILFWLGFFLHCFTSPWVFDYENPEPNLNAGSFPDWVWGCGICRVLGDILVITAMYYGWRDEKDEKTTPETEMGVYEGDTEI